MGESYGWASHKRRDRHGQLLFDLEAIGELFGELLPEVATNPL